MKKRKLFLVAAIRSSIFRLVLAQGISLVGSRCTAFALGIWLFQQTGKTTEILLIPFFQEVTVLLLNPFVGMIVDKFSRKTLMILADTIQAIGSVFCCVFWAAQLFMERPTGTDYALSYCLRHGPVHALARHEPDEHWRANGCGVSGC